jgi:hypothetical protein
MLLFAIRRGTPDWGTRLGSLLVASQVFATGHVLLAECRLIEARSLTKLAIVLHIYRLENGQYPERLQDLVPKYLPRLPEDLFSGQPPIYRRTEKGFVLYSVGPNGKDDGGRTAEDSPHGDDIRVQIPVPEPPGDTTGPKLPDQP